MSFTQGLSGLNAASKGLEVIGNNVANASTVGFKGSQAQFADVFAASLGGAGVSQIGIGAKLATVAQQFTQGNISVTNNTLDMAINGPGFFVMHGVNGTGYTRNGQFQLDKAGFIVSSTGQNLQGWQGVNGVVATSGAASNLQIPTASITPTQTSTVTVGLNLDSRKAPPIGAFDPAISTTFTDSTSTTTYDSLGNTQVTSLYFVATAVPNTWDVYTTVIDPKTGGYLYTNPSGALPAAPAPGTWVADGQLTFNTNGTFLASTLVPIAYNPPGATAQAVTFDFTSATQFGASFGVNALVQDGNTSGTLSGFSVAKDGTIMGRYSNGLTRSLGLVALATFPNNQGLQPLGDNVWAETGGSGAPVIGKPGAGINGVLQTASVEDSNVDLTAELVNMITAQRVYQANAQTIKTQDAVMQTLVNLR